MRFGVARGGTIVPHSPQPEPAEAFEVIDSAAPYVVFRAAQLRDPGEWTDLRPDYLGKDAEGHVVYAPGDGAVRARLATLGIKRSQWDAATREQRLIVIQAAHALDFAGSAIGSLLKHRHGAVKNRAEALLARIVEVAQTEFRPRGLRAEHQRATSFRKGKLLIPRVREALKQVNAAGKRARRSTFSNDEWKKARTSEINSVLEAAGCRGACVASDVSALAHHSPEKVARQVVGRALDLSPDVFRYDTLRSRSKSATPRPDRIPKRTR